MFGKLIGSLVSAPLRAIEVVAEFCEPVDCLGVADMAGNAAESVKSTVSYVLDGKDD